MDFRLLNSAFLPQAAELWDYCFEKRATSFTNGILASTV